MKNITFLILIIFFNSSFISYGNASTKGILEVNVDKYFGPNNELSNSYQNLIDQQTNSYIKDLLISAHDFASKNIKYKFGASSFTNIKSKKTHKTYTYIDCSGFANELFDAINLPYNFASSLDMLRQRSDLLDQFQFEKISNQVEKGFRPNTGDILAYNYPYKVNGVVKRKGHVVVVIDPKECIAINATSYVWPNDNSTVDRSKQGVYFQQILKGNCDDGLWKSWDSADNKFQVLLRHKFFTVPNLSGETFKAISQAHF